MDLRNHPSGAPTLYYDGEGNMEPVRSSECRFQLPGARDLQHVRKHHVREPGELGSGWQ
jgi:hypothetical protein